MGNKHTARILAFTAALLLIAACGGRGTPPAGAGDATGVNRLRAALADSGKFYLELRLGEKALHLCHSGVSLRRYPVKNLAVGSPKFLFIPRATSSAWINRTWRHGTFHPARVVNRVRIIPGDEKTRPTPDTPGVLPPTLQELTPVAPLWRLRFEGGLGLQFVLSGKVPGAEGTDRWGTGWREFMEGAWLREAVPTQVRLELDAADGASLYRSSPDAPDLLVTE